MIQNQMDFFTDDLYKLLFSFLIGAIIGAEREYRSKSAGLRTMILIAVGSTVFTLISIRISGDAGRIAANIVTGIGFIGAGIIFRENNRVVGITTAAIVWVTAALGMAIGAGYYVIALYSFLVAGMSLVVLTPFQKWIRNKNQIKSYRLKCIYQKKTLKDYESLFKSFGMTILGAEQNRSGSHITGSWLLQGSLPMHEKLTEYLLDDTGIVEFDF
ncbi:putative Mg2+ transporter-C (MgtC) family protein [Dyadobacter koreensis]|uniref:Putative Mg2+ transporter-C (MgtC) family protein n=1 Tax=Dyadobacter koreensis TaxID=408657 RepID=A0A1H6RPC0_9BACT|nr:MgtC/SapB family protein [Dyadobacter koreensis]SEI53042.1 putative Mg2+ transporter-C (MgtC) family protein [Dyadobacter koreensis]